MEVFVGSDHRGFELKGRLLKRLWKGQFGAEPFPYAQKSYDAGPLEYNPKDDFNDAAVAVAKAIQNDPGARGVLLCGSGDGMCIQANRFKRVRAVRCSSLEEVRVAREHDDINVLCLAADGLTEETMIPLVQEFLTHEFDPRNESRMRRINRLDERNDYDY